MPRKKRDYKAEYRRRIANAKKRGLSLSQARGHPKPGEKPIRGQAKRPQSVDALELAFRLMRELGTQKAAAKQAGVSTERLRRYVYGNKLAKHKKGKWQFTDKRKRQMLVLSEGKAGEQMLDGFKQASLNGEYLAAVKAFINSNDIEYLEAFDGQSVRDAQGREHLLETDPNELYRLAASGSEVFEDVYRLIMP